MLAHFRNRQLLATYAVGFGVLFNFICTFTYVSFRLAAASYNLSPAGSAQSSSSIWSVPYSPRWTGWAVTRFGRRHFMVGLIAVWIAGSCADAHAVATGHHTWPGDLGRAAG